MADRPNPYVPKDPGDIIRSGDWNELQVRAREEIRSHTHKGGEDGALIPRESIEENAIDGSHIDPEAEIELRTLTISDSLQVKGKLTLGDVNDLLASFKSLQSDMLVSSESLKTCLERLTKLEDMLIVAPGTVQGYGTPISGTLVKIAEFKMMRVGNYIVSV